MAQSVPIEIFNIAKTVVDKAEVKRWLDFLGATEFEIPDDGAITNPALLIALAGKRCYKAFQKSLNPNLTRIRKDYTEYFDNILKSSHGSVLEHAVFSFAIENVSRVFTGEMNRHRAGWAISEGSMRFIRYSESIPFWMPDSIKGPDVVGEDHIETYFEGIDTPQVELNNYVPCVADLISEWRNGDPAVPDTALDAEEVLGLKKEISRFLFKKAFSGQEQCYRWLEQVWADELKPESKFKAKKEITSMMRRIVGMGVATGGVWTGNVRALRHVITMRAAPEAEEEILHVFTRVAKMMRDAEPMLFGDFEQIDGKYWVPKYRKV